jgi:hypothetical protein
MPIDINMFFWEEEQPVVMGGQAPTSDPTTGAVPNQPTPLQGDQQVDPQKQQQAPPPEQQPQDNQQQGQPDVVTPDMPEEDSKPKSFQEWKRSFFKASVKNDPKELMDLIQSVRDHDKLEASQRKFVEDNWQIVALRQNPAFGGISQSIRKNIKQSLDRNNPGSDLAKYLCSEVERSTTPVIKESFIKLAGMYGMKSDIHRKLLACFLGSIQVGGGGSSEDIVYPEKDFSVRISTRCATQFGEISIGEWTLLRDDPRRYLSEPELKRLSEGSPGERQELRRRIVTESICDKFKNRAFLINVMYPDGTIYFIGWDLAECMRAGYKQGSFVVRTKTSAENEVMISQNGELISLIDLDVLYVKQGQMDATGKPRREEVPFLSRRDGTLYLTCSLENVKNILNGSLPGSYFKEVVYNGNPSDIKLIMRAVPSLEEMLTRRFN